MTFIFQYTNHLDDAKIHRSQHDVFDPNQNSKNQSLLFEVGKSRDGIVNSSKNGTNQNIHVSLGQYSVILKYLQTYKCS
jgi:hypothetical protein